MPPARTQITDDLPAPGLSDPRPVRPTEIACIEPSRILRRGGRLPARPMRRVLRQLRFFLPKAPASPAATPSPRAS